MVLCEDETCGSTSQTPNFEALKPGYKKRVVEETKAAEKEARSFRLMALRTARTKKKIEEKNARAQMKGNTYLPEQRQLNKKSGEAVEKVVPTRSRSMSRRVISRVNPVRVVGAVAAAPRGAYRAVMRR